MTDTFDLGSTQAWPSKCKRGVGRGEGGGGGGGRQRGGGVCTAPVGSAMAVLIPMRRPLLSSSTPPELPGLMAASVWMTLRIGTPLAPVCKDIPLSAMESSVACCSLHGKRTGFDSRQPTQATNHAQQTYWLQTHSLQTLLLQTRLLQIRTQAIISGTSAKMQWPTGTNNFLDILVRS